VLTGVQPGMPAFDEETFGPVATVTRVRDTGHAVELANRSRYGLAASVWMGDPRRGEGLAKELEAGVVFINEIVKSDPRLEVQKDGSWKVEPAGSNGRPCQEGTVRP
jgi:succinate-semialdehyde dehydrogenase/glutarate-semialdehyde dehydrogenase